MAASVKNREVKGYASVYEKLNERQTSTPSTSSSSSGDISHHSYDDEDFDDLIFPILPENSQTETKDNEPVVLTAGDNETPEIDREFDCDDGGKILREKYEDGRNEIHETDCSCEVPKEIEEDRKKEEKKGVGNNSGGHGKGRADRFEQPRDEIEKERSVEREEERNMKSEEQSKENRVLESVEEKMSW